MIRLVGTNDHRAVRNLNNIVELHEVTINQKRPEDDRSVASLELSQSFQRRSGRHGRQVPSGSWCCCRITSVAEVGLLGGLRRPAPGWVEGDVVNDRWLDVGAALAGVP
ncbi:hypothetical protein [Saccharothrix deserti]|uniref:hypothetical protein n=1 Tax=Saccharothrix deserti TaxID=2593674 RepID=UPI00131BB001|nr:hypothetical protein [Saccharothrix deserti]